MKRSMYKDFPKYDTRRYLVVLFSIERLADKATLHHISKDIECSRAEVQRAIESAEKNFHMTIEKIGPSYRIESWGIVDRAAAISLCGNFE